MEGGRTSLVEAGDGIVQPRRPVLLARICGVRREHPLETADRVVYDCQIVSSRPELLYDVMVLEEL